MRFMVDGHELSVVAADGSDVMPVATDNILIGMGETYDVIVRVTGSGSFAVRGQAQDGSGAALGVLHTPDAKPQMSVARPHWGSRQLAYGQLRSPERAPASATPDRIFELALTGNMGAYVWSLGEQVYPDADPLIVHPGERVRLQLTNRTGMWHPMHLHGHFFRLVGVGGDDGAAPRKHTVSMAPRQTATLDFVADNPGIWFFHCHNAYHLAAGMARVLRYEI